MEAEVKRKMSKFHLKAGSIETLKQLVSAVNVLADEAPLELNENGIHVRAMDPSRVAMIDAAWPKTIFEEYNCPEPIRVSVNLAELMKPRTPLSFFTSSISVFGSRIVVYSFLRFSSIAIFLHLLFSLMSHICY